MTISLQELDLTCLEGELFCAFSKHKLFYLLKQYLLDTHIAMLSLLHVCLSLYSACLNEFNGNETTLTLRLLYSLDWTSGLCITNFLSILRYRMLMYTRKYNFNKRKKRAFCFDYQYTVHVFIFSRM